MYARYYSKTFYICDCFFFLTKKFASYSLTSLYKKFECKVGASPPPDAL